MNLSLTHVVSSVGLGEEDVVPMIPLDNADQPPEVRVVFMSAEDKDEEDGDEDLDDLDGDEDQEDEDDEDLDDDFDDDWEEVDDEDLEDEDDEQDDAEEDEEDEWAVDRLHVVSCLMEQVASMARRAADYSRGTW